MNPAERATSFSAAVDEGGMGMSPGLTSAQQLLHAGDFAMAKSLLDAVPDDPLALRLLSLLYRYDDDYDKELEAVKRSLGMDGSDVYMQERLSWHALPLVDRVVPRRPLVLPRDPDSTPTHEMLDQLCFVTTGGSDEPFRQLLVELLESLEATRLYKDIPVYVFDAGLSDDDKHFLLNRFRQIRDIRDPGWDVDPGDLKDGYKATTARVFMNRHFPGHRYYLWIDTDCWVQDERALDDLVLAAHEQGIGICPDAVPSRKFYAAMPAPVHYLESAFLSGHPATDALFCIDAATGTFDDFQRVFLELYQHAGFYHFIGQFAINVILRNDGREAKLAGLQRVLHNVSVNELAGCPLLDANDHILDLQKEFAGVLHLTWNAKFLTPYHRPFIKSTAPDTSLEHSNAIELLFWRDQLPIRDDIRYASLCYRTWPWVDKPRLRALLLSGDAERSPDQPDVFRMKSW